MKTLPTLKVMCDPFGLRHCRLQNGARCSDVDKDLQTALHKAALQVRMYIWQGMPWQRSHLLAFVMG